MAYTEIVRVMLYLTAAAVATELILWVWCYRSPSFRSINEQVEKTSRKMDAMKASGKQKSAKQRSLADRMEKGIKREAAKEMAVFRFKQSLVVRDIHENHTQFLGYQHPLQPGQLLHIKQTSNTVANVDPYDLAPACCSCARVMTAMLAAALLRGPCSKHLLKPPNSG